jgi:D-inositol-3-phosphate glycosyltransferase
MNRERPMIGRLAYLSLHTSPLTQPGTGDAGGMNVYIHELARAMAQRGINVDVFTRRIDPGDPAVVPVAPGYRVVNVPAGPPHALPMDRLAAYIGVFSEGVVQFDRGYDAVHSHYWLSGWAGVLAKEAWSIPLANSFHTLGRIKDLTRRPDEAASSPTRTLTEDEVIARSDCIVASTKYESEQLLAHYQADPERLCVSPPGVDHEVFRPGDRAAARARLGFDGGPLLLYAGRIQAHKGIDVAIEALAALDLPDARLLIVGGPSGAAGETEALHLVELAGRLGLARHVQFVPPQPHAALASFYQAADVLVMPSRSESFGLVAAEAQACGLPVVAARIGGLADVVADGVAGHLIDGWEADAYAAAIRRIVADPGHAAALGEGAARHAARFSWPATVDRLIELYEGMVG